MLLSRLNSTDKLLVVYLAFLTVLVTARGMLTHGLGGYLVAMNVLVAIMLLLFARSTSEDRIASTLHVLYPVILLIPFYWQIGALGQAYGMDRAAVHDQVIQHWEAALFGGQVSYEWMRRSPSIFWSTILHAAYFFYYIIIVSTPIALVARGTPDAARRVIGSMMIAFVTCYVIFVLYPVGGPYYAFARPEGPVMEVWSARLVYWVLSGGSSFGAAFPSSHVAATVATVCALWFEWRRLAAWYVVPTILLTVGTVYCQMHYVLDATSGVLVGLLASACGVLTHRASAWRR